MLSNRPIPIAYSWMVVILSIGNGCMHGFIVHLRDEVCLDYRTTASTHPFSTDHRMSRLATKPIMKNTSIFSSKIFHHQTPRSSWMDSLFAGHEAMESYAKICGRNPPFYQKFRQFQTHFNFKIKNKVQYLYDYCELNKLCASVCDHIILIMNKIK